MVIFFVVLVDVALVQFCLAVARLWRAMFARRLVVATTVARIMVVCVVAVLPVVVVVVAAAAAWLAIFRVVAALLIGVLGLVAMDVARHTSKLQRSLLFGPIAFVAAVVRWFIVAIAIAIIAIITTA
jgi:hypothetical protein